MGFNQQYQTRHHKRFVKTLRFLSEVAPPPGKILDLGPVNPFTEMMQESGYEVDNTPEGLDLDYEPEIAATAGYDLVTAFEIFEHLLNPFTVLRNITAPGLVASVPLNLWFANAYWSETDPYDRHYHEFEDRQFDMLLEKCGWTIKKREKWTGNPKKIGIRSLLRKITPRHYIVYCEKKQTGK